MHKLARHSTCLVLPPAKKAQSLKSGQSFHYNYDMNAKIGKNHPWEAESYRYYSRDSIPGQNRLPPQQIIEFLLKNRPSSVLDVGCGSGAFLADLTSHLSASVGHGIEPSPRTVKALEEKWSSRDDLKFSSGCGESIEFADGSFELVIAWSVLHWVDRQYFLQFLGELVRVSSRFILVMDFFPSRPYRTPYRHRPDSFTYKTDFVTPLLSTSVLEPRVDLFWTESQRIVETFFPFGGERPFLNNADNWDARRAVVLEKSLEICDVYSETDFRGVERE